MLMQQLAGTPKNHPGLPPTSGPTLSSVPLVNLSLSPLSPSPSLSELWVPLEGQGMDYPGLGAHGRHDSDFPGTSTV